MLLLPCWLPLFYPVATARQVRVSSSRRFASGLITWELIGLWMMGEIEDWPCQKNSRHSG